MKDKPFGNLHDIRYACEKITLYTNDLEYDEWREEIKTQDAVRACFSDIAEATVRIRDHFPDLYPRIPDKKEIKDFRNHLIHQYDDINLTEVWDTIMNDIPELSKKNIPSFE